MHSRDSRVPAMGRIGINENKTLLIRFHEMICYLAYFDLADPSRRASEKSALGVSRRSFAFVGSD